MTHWNYYTKQRFLAAIRVFPKRNFQICPYTGIEKLLFVEVPLLLFNIWRHFRHVHKEKYQKIVQWPLKMLIFFWLIRPHASCKPEVTSDATSYVPRPSFRRTPQPCTSHPIPPPNKNWLVVLTILKNISQWEGLYIMDNEKCSKPPTRKCGPMSSKIHLQPWLKR